MTMKKTNIFIYIGLLVLAAGFSSCKKFEYYQVNPNEPTEASPGLLLNNIEQSAFSAISLNAALASRNLIYVQSASGPGLFQSYGWQRSDFNIYDNLRQVVKMKKEAERVVNPNYTALGLFFQSYYIIQITEIFGDVPYSEALQGDEGKFQPAYDAQEDIFLKVLNDLKTANEMLSESNGPVTGDIIYNGDLQKWKKAINSFSLRVLMTLSAKKGAAKLDVVTRFKAITADPAKYPVFASNADNTTLPYYDLENNRYPNYNSNTLKTDYYLDLSFVNMLQNFKDPRLFVYADKMPSASGLPVKDFNAYGGTKGSGSLQENVLKVVAGNVSPIHHRYYDDPVNEPSLAIGYSEIQFIMAEAVVREWISGDAGVYYKNGIKASLEFSNYKNTYSNSDINDYLNQPVIQLQSGQELKQILTQKHISFFLNSGWENFYNQRRTGVPDFETAGAGILNGGKIPKRWMYPESELNLNKSMLQTAIQNQYGGKDDINGVMWLLK